MLPHTKYDVFMNERWYQAQYKGMTGRKITEYYKINFRVKQAT
jgi:hypothetical protein